MKIALAAGSMLEEGDAQLQTDGLHWVYTATKENTSPAGDKIPVTAWDLPNHKTVKEEVK